MSFEELLVHKIYKQTLTSSQNDFGEFAYTYITQTSRPITCRISPLTGNETIDTTGRYDNVRYKCFISGTLPVSSLRMGDRIMYSSNLTLSADIYRVKELIIDSNSHHKTALLTQL